VRDIDLVIDHVHRDLPDIVVDQEQGTWPGDDDGLWFFRLPGVRNEMQMEHTELDTTDMCPFFIEHSGMASGADAWVARTVEGGCTADSGLSSR